MRIGFYHDAAGTRHAGGIAVYTQQMAAHLAASHEVSLYTQRGDRSPLLAESDVTVVETPSFRDRSRLLDPLGPQNQRKLKMTAWAYRNGLVEHINETLDVLVTFQFLDDLLLSNLVDVPTVYLFHRLSDVGIGALARERFSRTDLLLANSDDTARRVREEFGYEVDDVIYPGVERVHFHPDVEPAISSHDPIVLFVGRLIEAKGIDDLLEAVAQLDGRQELHFVGRGDADRLRARAQELGIGDAVICHGEVPHPELPSYYVGADVFCLPSHDESFGMANVEAMACGCPVVTTNLEGIKTYLVNGENGLLVCPGDPQDIADKLTIILDSPDRAATLGEQARQDVAAFTWKRQANRLLRAVNDRFSIDDRVDQPITDVVQSGTARAADGGNE